MKLEGKVHEIRDPAERIAAIAKDYVSDPDQALVISPDNLFRETINRAIHRELQIDGSVESTGQQVEVLSPRQDLIGAERRWRRNTISGMSSGIRGAAKLPEYVPANTPPYRRSTLN
jgi:hypothetical protein